MWLSDRHQPAVATRRRVLATLMLLPVAACGFAPAFGPEGAAGKVLSAIVADNPTDKNGFDLVERLEQRLGRSAAPVYQLSYAISNESTGVGVTSANAITRYNITGSVRFTLLRIQGGTTMTEGEVHSFTSYSATTSTVSTLAAERDAHARLMRLLADQIVARLVATSGTWQK